MDLLLLVSGGTALPIALELCRALNRARVPWGAFFTDDGVRLIDNVDVVDALRGAVRAVACERSWERHSQGGCPVELGSQTSNSEMFEQARRVVSL